MRCNICDKVLSEEEIQLTPDGKEFEPCSICLDIALDAAYCDGFLREEPLDDPELNEEFGDGSVELLDPEFLETDTWDNSFRKDKYYAE